MYTYSIELYIFIYILVFIGLPPSCLSFAQALEMGTSPQNASASDSTEMSGMLE